jgi:hypothetical protein
MPAWREPERIRSSIEAARAKPGELTLASVGPGAALGRPSQCGDIARYRDEPENADRYLTMIYT